MRQVNLHICVAYHRNVHGLCLVKQIPGLVRVMELYTFTPWHGSYGLCSVCRKVIKTCVATVQEVALINKT